jgi:hypothetical protein
MAKRTRGRDPFVQSEALGPAAMLSQESAVLYYDYALLPIEQREPVQRAARMIKPLLKRTAEDIFVIGNELRAIKAMLPHGRYTEWLDVEFGLSDRMAQHFVNVRERLGPKSEKFSVLPPSTLYLLAAPSTPDAAIAQVEARIDAGERLTRDVVQGTIVEAKFREESALRRASSTLDFAGQIDRTRLDELSALEEVIDAAMRLLGPSKIEVYERYIHADEVRLARQGLHAALAKVRERMGQIRSKRPGL